MVGGARRTEQGDTGSADHRLPHLGTRWATRPPYAEGLQPVVRDSPLRLIAGRCQVGGAHPTELQSWLLSVTPAGIAGIRADLERFPDAHHRALSPNVGSPHPDPLPGAEGVGPRLDPPPGGEGGAEVCGSPETRVDRKLNMPWLLSVALRRLGPQQRPEPGLFEVVIAGQRVGDTLTAHCDERNTIRQTPALVGVPGKELQPLVKQHRGARHNLHMVVSSQRSNRGHSPLSDRWLAHGVKEFEQNVFGCQEVTFDAGTPGHRAGVMGIASSHEGDEV